MQGEEPTGLKPMAQRYERPAWVRRLNSIVEASGASLRDLVPIDADALVETGVRAAGGMPKGDFGDPHWQDAFLRLARSIDTGDLHLLGRLLTKGELLRSVRSCLLMTHEVDNKPAILDGKVAAPVIVTGPHVRGLQSCLSCSLLTPISSHPQHGRHYIPSPTQGTGMKRATNGCSSVSLSKNSGRTFNPSLRRFTNCGLTSPWNA